MRREHPKEFPQCAARQVPAIQLPYRHPSAAPAERHRADRAVILGDALARDLEPNRLALGRLVASSARQRA